MAMRTDEQPTASQDDLFARWVAFSVQNRFLIIFFVLLAGVIGVRSMRELPVDAVPDVTNVQVQVLTNAPGLGPLDVERFVTFPVESVMSGLPRVDEVRSLSRFGLSAVTIVFEEGTDIYFARQLVSERLSEARNAIPVGFGEPEMGPISSGLGEIYQFEVRGEPMCAPDEPDTDECYTSMELRTTLDWFIAYQLRPIDGVVEVNSFGGELKTYEVTINPERLTALGLTLQDVFEALETNNGVAGGGYIEHAGEQRLIRGEGLISSLEELRQVVIDTREGGTPITIAEVAEVRFAPMIRQGAVTRDGRGEAVTGIVMMLIGANSGKVSRAVRDRLDELGASLPPGVTIDTFYDRADLVDRTVDTVSTNLIEGGILVIVVLLLLLGNLRGGLLIAAVIPLAMLATFIVMEQFGVSGNLMSLGALDFGLIIDGAVVMIEHIVRVLGERGTVGEKDVRRVTIEAGRQVARPVVFAVGVIMIVYVPILTLEGIEGKLFRPMAITVLAALAAALILALTLVPAVASWVYRGGVSERETLLMRLARWIYSPLLSLAMRLRWLTITGTLVVLIAAALFIGPRLGAEFIPTLDEGAIAMQAIRPPSTSLEESILATTRIEQTLLERFPDEVDTVISRTGRAEIATDPMGVEISDIFVMLHPPEQWTRADSKDALVTAMEATLTEEVPGQNYSFSQPIELRTNELISGVRADVAINLYGPDLATLKRVGDDIAEALQKVPGAVGVQADQVAGLPSLRVKVRRDALARYGLSADEVLAAISVAGGQLVGEVIEGQKRFALQVRLREDARQDLDALSALLIASPSGPRVPLGQLADLDIIEGPSVISRENVQRRRTIQVNVLGRDLAGFVEEAKARIAEEVDLPPNYVLDWGGQFKNLEAATERLMIAVPATLVLIFVLLYITFGSARPALLIYLNVPVAATGGLVALWLRGMPFSISAAVGFIALSGIAVLNGVVMVSYFRELQSQGVDRQTACIKGAQLRLRPVLMTAMTDAIGFFPMAISASSGAEVQRPLATVVIGGLASATFLTLFVLPVVYSWLGGDVSTSNHDDIRDEREEAYGAVGSGDSATNA